ncbi:MAG TPA: basic secretory protein-like protein [Lacipirellula sp.]
MLAFSTVTIELHAEVSVIVDRNEGDAATDEFSFDEVRPPSDSDAGNEADFTVITGRRDGNGADLECLNDGKLPSDPDEPGANFFFAAGTPGGRLLVDLGRLTTIRRMATYSWHPGPRGPQVYKLYGATSKAADFDAAKAGKSESLAEDAWNLLADIDSRPKDGEPGGQYGVSVSGEDGAPLGEYRYLLLDISRTGAHQWFDNTFFSEIDVDDGKKHARRQKQVERVVDVLKIGDRYEIAFDTTDAPELKPWVDEKLKPICATWYPKIVEMLPSDDYQAPRRFAIVFEKDMRGVAYTSGRRVVCAAPWFKDNLEGEAAGAVVHELVHVVQQYGRARTGNRSPGWMVEGLADYIRWFLYEPEELRPRPNPDRAHYTDSYRTTGAFLDFVVNEYDENCIRKFNAAMRDGAYSDELWRQYTGQSADELWTEFVKTLRR